MRKVGGVDRYGEQRRIQKKKKKKEGGKKITGRGKDGYSAREL